MPYRWFKNIFIEKGQSLWPLQRILVVILLSFSSSFVPYVVSFSGLSFLSCPLVFFNVHFLVLCPFLFGWCLCCSSFQFLLSSSSIRVLCPILPGVYRSFIYDCLFGFLQHIVLIGWCMKTRFPPLTICSFELKLYRNCVLMVF